MSKHKPAKHDSKANAKTHTQASTQPKHHTNGHISTREHQSNTPLEDTRWNGWGNANVNKTVSKHGAKLIKSHIGKTKPLKSVSLQHVIDSVPASRLPKAVVDLNMVSTDAETRVRHARGQSFPDWIAMHSGEFGTFPDGVAMPTSTADVEQLLALAEEHDLVVIPFGGGTSVVGHINPQADERPILTVAMYQMDRLIDFDAISQIATFGAGTQGPAVEAQLAEHGYRLGHFPQSWELSTLGGWIASRSSGQQSLGYGRIEQLFAGGTLVTPEGVLDIPAIPASSAGPDLREMMMGTEGRAGIFTEVKVRVQPVPDAKVFKVVFLPNWQAGKAVLREAVQRGIGLSMLRLSNSEETNAHLHLGTSPSQFTAITSYLKLRGMGKDKVMMTYGVSGEKEQTAFALKQFKKLLNEHGGVGGTIADVMGKIWAHGRFKFPYLRGTLWDRGIMVDTFETATNWSNIDEQMQAMQTAVRDALSEEGESVMAFTHISHVYKQGASLYTTYFFRAGKTHEATLKRWQKIKHVASLSVANGKATISHQHGVGRDHAPYLQAEKGELGLQVTADMLASLDPDGRMNPGVLVDEGVLGDEGNLS